MKKAFDNLKPFIIYFISILIYLALDSSRILNHTAPLIATVFALAVYFVLTALFAYFTEFKKSKYGVIAFVIMLVISPIINTVLHLPFYELIMIGNAFFSVWLPELIPFEYEILLEPFYMIFYYFLGIIVPLMPFALGYVLQKSVNKNKPAAI